jgi:anti-anti-sigma factor
MKILESKQGAVTVLKPNGPLIQNDAAELKAVATRVLEATLGRFVVDLTSIPYIDSQGLEVLVDVTENMSESGQMLKLCAANKTLREVLNLAGVASLFEHFDDVNTAIRSFL